MDFSKHSTTSEGLSQYQIAYIEAVSPLFFVPHVPELTDITVVVLGFQEYCFVVTAARW